MTIGAGDWRPQLWVGSAAGTSYPGGSGWLLGSLSRVILPGMMLVLDKTPAPGTPSCTRKGTCPQQPFLVPMLRFPAPQASADLGL